MTLVNGSARDRIRKTAPPAYASAAIPACFLLADGLERILTIRLVMENGSGLVKVRNNPTAVFAFDDTRLHALIRGFVAQDAQKVACATEQKKSFAVRNAIRPCQNTLSRLNKNARNVQKASCALMEAVLCSHLAAPPLIQQSLSGSGYKKLSKETIILNLAPGDTQRRGETK